MGIGNFKNPGRNWREAGRAPRVNVYDNHRSGGGQGEPVRSVRCLHIKCGEFAALEDSRHFYVDVMRGRVRSLQLRLDEAFEYFEGAAARAISVRPTVPDLCRQFLLHIYCFENALLKQRIDCAAPSPELSVPDFPESILREYPEVAYVLDMRLSAEAHLRLHLGDYHEAGEIFSQLIESTKGPPDSKVAVHFAGLAAAQHNLGLRDLAEASIENAALAVHAGGKLLNTLRAASVLASLHLVLERRSEADEWRSFINSLSCPRATKDAFLMRERILSERCRAQECLLVL